MKALQFNILKHGIPHYHIFYLVQAVSALLDHNSANIMKSIVQDVETVAWYHLFTHKIQIGKESEGALSCAIL